MLPAPHTPRPTTRAPKGPKRTPMSTAEIIRFVVSALATLARVA